MAIVYDPAKMLRKAVPEAKIKKMLTKNASLKKTALTFIDGLEFIDKKAVAETALKTVQGYQQRLAKIEAEGGSRDASKEEEKEIVKDPAQLIQRVENEVVFQVKEKIRENYKGETYTWLPSDADEPDPEHQLNYGKTFTIGDGEMPGDRIGCRCGMEINVKQTELELD